MVANKLIRIKMSMLVFCQKSSSRANAGNVKRCQLAWHQIFKAKEPAAHFSKVQKHFRPKKLCVKFRPAYSVKPVFSYVAKGIKIKITAKFRASRHLCCEDTKRIVTQNAPETFEGF